jgi:hypothetical protein
VPGYVGTRSVKWLRRLTLAAAESSHKLQTRKELICCGAAPDTSRLYPCCLPLCCLLLRCLLRYAFIWTTTGQQLRLVVPGYVGTRSVKWLKRLTLAPAESSSAWQQKDYKILPQAFTTLSKADFASMPPIMVRASRHAGCCLWCLRMRHCSWACYSIKCTGLIARLCAQIGVAETRAGLASYCISQRHRVTVD